ncbi:MAG: amidohydrolase [Anaerolineaceae bacterium]|nr:amidohydrolase [Anaerolineaceae bacterium]
MRKCYEQILNTVHWNNMPLLIRNCAYLIRSPEKVEQGCDILIEGSHIQAIGPNLQPPAGTDVLDGSRCVAMPGLINAHTHLYQNLIKGIAPGVPLVPWCNEVLFPTVGALRTVMNSKYNRTAYLWSAIATIEMVKGGITCCVNMDVTSPAAVQAWEDIGFRGVMAYTLSNRWVPAQLRSAEMSMKQKALEFVDACHHPGGLTTVFLAPSTLFLCTDEFLGWAGEVAHQLDLGIQMHISETAGEVTDHVQETGRRPVETLDYLGLLDSRLSAVHCCHVNAVEIELLAKSGTSVVHCPKSNMKLADGIAPVTAMRAAHIPVSVATDGCASNDLLDMWEEMRTAVLLARVSQNDAAALGPRDAFAMATTDAARAARVDAGELQPGKLADVTLVEIKSPSLRPFHAEDVFNMLVFCGKASDVRDVIIHGKVILRERLVVGVDEQDLLQEAETLEVPLFRMRKDQSFAPELSAG